VERRDSDYRPDLPLGEMEDDMVAQPVRMLIVAVLSVCPVPASGENANDEGRAPEALAALRGRPMEGVVKMAVLEAYRRLEDPRCREIFGDFHDLDGRSLQENLDAIGQTGPTFLAGTVYFDGTSRQGCRGSDVLAFTAAGSRVVFICGDRFRRQLDRRGLGPLAVMIIHEELHSLGLGENPPSPDEISRRVASRCGS
jgi:hypothetical protein